MKTHTMLMSAALVAGVLAVPAAMAADSHEDGTVLALSAQAHKTVAQDRIRATLRFENVAKTAAEAQNSVNQAMQAATALCNGEPGVKTTTGGYNVWKQYPNDPQPKSMTPAEREKDAMWQASQELVLDSADKDTVLGLVGKLQQRGFAVQGMDFYLSREASDAVKDDLMVEALGTIGQRAKRVADVLGLKHISYDKVDMTGTMPRPPVPMMAKAMSFASAEAAAPVAQAGDTDVTVTVNADVRLR